MKVISPAREKRRLSGGLGAAALAIAAVLTAGAAGQSAEKIPSETRQAQSPLSGTQQDRLDRYARSAAEGLQSDEPSNVRAARRRLLAPLRSGGTRIFYSAYSTAVSNALSSVLESGDRTVRLNGMIVVSRLRGMIPLSLIERGIGDDAPGVRYWAAGTVSAIQQRAGADTDRGLEPGQKERVLELFSKQLVRESAEPVVQRMMVALVRLNLEAATERVLEALEKRVDERERTVSVEADYTGLRTVFRRVVEKAAGAGVADAVLRRLTRVAYKDLLLAARMLDAGRVSVRDNPAYARLVRLCDRVVRWSARKLAPDLELPEAIDPVLQRKNWARIKLMALDDWQALLKGEALGFDPFNLEVSMPKKDGGQGAGPPRS
jgi:hypothetical protein